MPLAVPVPLALNVSLHLLTANRYGIFRDELYYIACARHPAFGYVDHPPLIAFVTWYVLHTLGSTLFALRLLPALAGGALVWLTSQIARELGGGKCAQAMAAFAVLPVPVFLILQHWLTMNAFEPLFWTGMMWAAVRMAHREQPRLWLLIGILVGLGLENKYSMLLPVGALVLGLLLTPERRLLQSRYFVLAVLIAILIVLPNLLWLSHHGFPFIEFERHSRASGSRILRGPLSFLTDQASMMNPVLVPLILAGLFRLFQVKPFRFAGWTAFLVIAALLILKAKNYYAAPIYPVLLAAGAVALEQASESRRRLLRPAYALTLAVSGAVLAPLVMPLLSIPDFLAYQRLWRGWTPVRFEALEPDLLPQHFSDEFGWEEMVQRTATAYARLTQEQQKQTAIFANNYGEASAIDFFGPRLGLPAAISGSESFWLWGPRGFQGRSAIVLGSDGKGDRRFFATVEAAGQVGSPYARAEERFTLFLGRGLHSSLPALWPELKRW